MKFFELEMKHFSVGVLSVDGVGMVVCQLQQMLQAIMEKWDTQLNLGEHVTGKRGQEGVNFVCPTH